MVAGLCYEELPRYSANAAAGDAFTRRNAPDLGMNQNAKRERVNCCEFVVDLW